MTSPQPPHPEWVVLSVGGSLLNDGQPNMDMARAVAGAIRKSGKRIGIVVGGGKEARAAAQAARERTGSEYYADVAGIAVTHKNAEALRQALGAGAGPKAYITFDDAAEAAKTQHYVVMGGTIPGITTDADSALLAEALYAKKLVNLSNTAIYDSDPRKNPNAKKYERMTFDQLRALANASDARKAGTNFVFDLLACSLVARSGIETHFVDGRNLQDVEAAIEGRPHGGTVVGR